MDFYTQRVPLPTGLVKLSIWDLAGQEHFEVVRTGFYAGSRATALVYDVTNPASLLHLKGWQKEVLRALPGQPLVVIGNKIDLKRAVPRPIAQAFASSIGVPYLETSAFTDAGVADLFATLAALASQ